jgi:hypothetical protein
MVGRFRNDRLRNVAPGNALSNHILEDGLDKHCRSKLPQFETCTSPHQIARFKLSRYQWPKGELDLIFPNSDG